MTARAAGARWPRMVAAWMRRTGASPESGTARDQLGVENDVEAVRERDAVAGGHERLRFDGLVAVAGMDDPRRQSRFVEHVVGQTCGGAVMGPDPRLAAKVADIDERLCGQRMAAGQQHAQDVVEERQELDVGRWRVGLEGVLEDDRDVELAGGQAAEGVGAVDEHVFDHLLLAGEEGRVVGLQACGERGGEEDEGGEERAEPHAPGAESGEVGDLRFGELEAIEDHVGVLGQQPACFGGLHALLSAPDQLRADALLEQRHLPGHRRLRETDGVPGGRERPVRDDRPQGRELADVEHARSLERRCRIPMCRYDRARRRCRSCSQRANAPPAGRPL